jgi:hypothetical protein
VIIREGDARGLSNSGGRGEIIPVFRAEGERMSIEDRFAELRSAPTIRRR